MKRKYDKVNNNVGYVDSIHEYTDLNDNEKYISVTTLIHKYTNPFDEEFWSSYKACEEILGDEFSKIKFKLLETKKWDYKILKEMEISLVEFEETRSRILKGYELERNKSCERGTKIHKELEEEYLQGNGAAVKKYGLGGKFECRKDYYQLDLEKGIYPEFLISMKSKDGILRVAGQIDLLIKDGNDIYLVDHKSNREIKKAAYYDKWKKKKQTMLFPLDNLDDTNYWHYSLQLSLYAYLLQQINPSFNIKSLKLNHIDHNDNITEYDCPYLKNEAIKMLNHYKKSIKIKGELDLDKPIVF